MSSKYLVVDPEWARDVCKTGTEQVCPDGYRRVHGDDPICANYESCFDCHMDGKDIIRPLTATEMRAGKMEEVLKRVDMFVFPNTGDTYGLTAEISSILADIQKAKETTPEHGQGKEVQR